MGSIPVNSLTMVDAAGAAMGGAARYVKELDDYLLRSRRTDITVYGRGRRLSPGHVVRRELDGRGVRGRVALNNVAFLAEDQTVLLRNALQFLSTREEKTFADRVSSRFFYEARVVRTLARRAARVVVPSSIMAERVISIGHVPAEKVIVRGHPVSPVARAARHDDTLVVLVPIVFAPFKRLDLALPPVLAAIERYATTNRRPVEVRATLTAADLAQCGIQSPVVHALGPMSAATLAGEWARADAILFPTTLESFGYPLAEAATGRIPVIAEHSAWTAEIAGNALCGYRPHEEDSIATAVARALENSIPPDSDRDYGADAYFSWLFALGLD